MIFISMFMTLQKISNWQSYATTTVQIKLSFLDVQRLLLLSMLGARRRHNFVWTNTHFRGYSMLSVSTLPCGKHWVCLVGGAGKEGTAVNSDCETMELLSSKNGMGFSWSGPGGEGAGTEVGLGRRGCLGRSWGEPEWERGSLGMGQSEARKMDWEEQEG